MKFPDLQEGDSLTGHSLVDALQAPGRRRQLTERSPSPSSSAEQRSGGRLRGAGGGRERIWRGPSERRDKREAVPQSAASWMLRSPAWGGENEGAKLNTWLHL